MNKITEIDPPFKPFDFREIIHDPHLFHDLEDGKSWALRPHEDNFMEKFVGFCPLCGSIYTSRWAIHAPHTKIFLGTRCLTYWQSIAHLEIPIEYCGHPEELGWKTMFDVNQG